MTTVVRVNKLRETMPKLILPANDALDDDELEELRKSMKRVPLSLSPSLSPIPPDDIETEIDPDNVVIRGSYTDDEWWLVSTKRNKEKCSLFFYVAQYSKTNKPINAVPLQINTNRFSQMNTKKKNKQTNTHTNKRRLCIREWRSSLFLSDAKFIEIGNQIRYTIFYIFYLAVTLVLYLKITKQIIYRLENVLLMFFDFR